jgi:hypothetical protein
MRPDVQSDDFESESLEIVTAGSDSNEFEAQDSKPFNERTDQLHSPLSRNDYNPAIYSPGSHNHIPPPQLLSPSPIMANIPDIPLPTSSPPMARLISPQAKIVKEIRATESPPKSIKDIVWLIQTLRYDGGASRDEKKKAIAELKRLAKSASEEYWRRNCAQVCLAIVASVFSFPTSLALSPDRASL